MALGIGPHNGTAATQAVNSDLTTAGGGGAGGYLNEQKDAKGSSTDPNFGEIMKQFQAKYGAKPEKAREIKKTLGKDDFLKIMITQMKNQDPTKPFNADQMAAQMAQYASVEQLQNVNQNIQKLDNDNKVNERMQMAGMIGKEVTIDRERFPHIEGQNESLEYTLPNDASEVKISIIAENGEPILEKDLGPQKRGDQSFSWDGLKQNTIATKNGTYIFKIAAKDAKGIPIQINPKTKGKVIGVGFEGTEPFFLVGDAHSQQKVTMKNIIAINEDKSQGMAGIPPQLAALLAGAQGAPQGAPQKGAEGTGPAATTGKFFGFKRGEGSQNLDSQALSPEAQAALARYQGVGQPQQGQAIAAGGNAAGSTAGALAGATGGVQNNNVDAQSMGTASGKGFPSGLSDSGQ